MDVSIIILNYNSEPLTLDAIRSIRQKTSGIEYEIIVVDNASKQGTENLKKEVGIRLIELSENVGFGRGNNRGTELATGKYLLFLNSDILLRNNAIHEQKKYLDEHPEVVAVGGNLYNAEGQACHSYRERLPNPIDDICWAWNKTHNNRSYPVSVGYIIGADLMVRKDAFLTAGGFDPDFFLYYEDAELCHRLSKIGLLHVIPQAEYTHLESQSQTSILSKQHFLLTSRKLYYQKVKPAYQLRLSNILVALRAYLHIVAAHITRKPESIDYWKLTLRELK